MTTGRLALTPLRVEDAEPMAGVLDDERLHTFTGGRPLTAAELAARYTRLLAGPPDPAVTWLNWIVRLAADGTPVGIVEATLGGRHAHLAWIIGVPWQGRGYASEAACALVARLSALGTEVFEAHVHPDHHASAAVAARAGLRPTPDTADGERVWRLSTSGHDDRRRPPAAADGTPPREPGR